MQTLYDATVAEMVEMLDANLREEFEERAGIIEYDGGKTRAHAEALALLSLIDRHPEALSAVTVFWVEVDGKTHWIVTTDRELAEEHVAARGATKCGVVDVAFVVDENFGGVAEITAAA